MARIFICIRVMTQFEKFLITPSFRAELLQIMQLALAMK